MDNSHDSAVKKAVKKPVLENPITYVAATIIILTISFAHYQKTSDSYSPSQQYRQKAEKLVKKEKSFLQTLKTNQCYAVDVIERIENQHGNTVDLVPSTTVSYAHKLRYTPQTYLVLDGVRYKLKNKVLHYGKPHTVQYFVKNMTYHCIQGGVSYSTPYYFPELDFKNLSDYNKLGVGEAIGEAKESNTIKFQPVFNDCERGLTLLFKQNCES